VILLDGDLIIRSFNPAAERMLERDGDEAEGRNVFEVFPEARGTPLEEKLTQALRDKAPSSFETEIVAGRARNRYNVRLYPQGSPARLSLLIARASER